MKNQFSYILRTKISAFAGKSLLLHFPARDLSFLLLTSLVANANSNNGQFASFQMVLEGSALNNQRNQQSNQQQQQNRMT